MGNRREYPVEFMPTGLTDAQDSISAFPGACTNLANLILDQENPGNVIARPGVGTPLTSFSGFSTPTSISVQITLGSVIYGMVASATNPGYDEPFAYDISTRSFITITGTTSSNVPASLPTTGDITPPTMAVIGVYIVITHMGYDGTGTNFFGVINITTPSAPVYSTSNIASNPLPSVPTYVANYNNRANFVIGNQIYQTDVLNPLSKANPSSILTVGDTTSITALNGLPIQTMTAGVVSAMVVFKGFQIWQVTGDTASSDLAQNFISLSFGTQSPRSVVQTPIGIIFAAPDGPYFINLVGSVLPLAHPNTPALQDINAPFHQIQNPGRAAAAFYGRIYRICMQTTINGVSGTYDYWYDITFNRWSGPHTFGYDCISVYDDHFILSNVNIGAALFESTIIPFTTSIYSDNGTPITCSLTSALFAPRTNPNVKQVIESVVQVAEQGSNNAYQVTAFDENLTTLSNATISSSISSSLWGGGGTWGGGGAWQAATANPTTKTIAWDSPLIFVRMGITISTQANYYTQIGKFFAKYRDCGYFNINP